MPHLRPNRWANSTALFSILLVAATAYGIQPPEKKPDLQRLVFARPDLYIPTSYLPLQALPAELGPQLKGELDLLDALEAGKPTGYYDLRAGRWGTIVQSRPLVPGPGNDLTWGIRTASGASDAGYRAAVWDAFKGYLSSNKKALRIDLADLGSEPKITLLENHRVVQINAPRFVGGIPVRGSYVTAVVNSGNLVLFGARHWGDVTVSTQPSIGESSALAKVTDHLGPHAISGSWRETRLEILPVANGADGAFSKGEGYGFRLVWVVSPRIAGDGGSWEALVDAATGELLQFADRNQYFDRKVTGGVYPISNDGSTPEEPGWPMPYADVVQPFGTGFFANSHGLVDDGGGLLRTTLNGKYVRMNDQCGAIDEALACSDVDLSSGAGTDCDVPPGEHSPGNTHSSRTGFYEVNRIIEQARGWLPENEWLHSQVTANMNIPEACNAFWDGLTINFYRSGTSGTNVCRNTGEIPAVFDHEWGHGMDDNDARPDISLPGEAPADMYSMLRLNNSCIAQGFFASNSIGGFCTGAGDPCTTCTGVRDADWAKRRSGLPHDITWIKSPVRTPEVTGIRPGGGCVGAVIGPPPPIPTVSSGPCGQSTHCEGNVVSEVIWDLVHRDLTAPPFDMDVNTALNLVARLQYLGGGNVDFWFQCVEGGIGGCNADGGYMNYLAIDDDDGNLSNGTPHMTAIFNAYDRHQMACPTPAPVDGGCAGAPAVAPSVTVAPLGNAARVSWGAVPGATKYWVFRTDGIHGCEFGKERVAITTEREFTDTGLLDGRTYFYTVEAVGANDSCRSAASACASVVPTAKAAEAEALLAFREVPNALVIQSGDGDPFLDNCETSRFSFQVENAGTVNLTNVRLVRVTPVSHPGTQVLTPLPLSLASTLAGGACGGAAIAPASFTFVPQGVANEEPLDFEFEIEGTSAAFGPVSLVGRIRLTGTESDFQFFSSKTFSFEEGFEGWNIVSGTYSRQSPGAPPTGGLFHLASSAFTAGQCDEIQSPQIRLRNNSSLSLTSQFATEPGTEETGFYDRANVGIFDLETGARTTITPDGGLRPYNATGANGVCVTAGESGWAGGGPGFLPSSWSAQALGTTGPDGISGRRVRLDVAYGTDPLVEGAGFQFDEVTLTNFELQVPDEGDDVCPPPPKPDLKVTGLTTSANRAREGDKVTVTATVTNDSSAASGASMTEFRLDNTTILGQMPTPSLAGGASASVSVQWDTRGIKGSHTLFATADAGLTVSESNENNNTSALAVSVQGNKVKNGSFEQSNASSSGPEGWSGESTGAGSASWSEGGSDGSKSAGASGNGGNAAVSGAPSWTSDAIPVSPGEVLTLVLSVEAQAASSAATAGLVYLGAAGQVLNSVTLLTAPLTTSGFAKLEQVVTIPAGVAQVRVKLVGFSPTDLRTSGTVRFDDVGLFGN